MMILGEEHLRRVVVEYFEHYHRERKHQGLDGRFNYPAPHVGTVHGKVRRRQRLGEMLDY